AQASAVDVRHAAEIEQDALLPLMHQLVDLVLERFIALTQGDLALQVENRHLVDDSFLDLHAGLPPRKTRPKSTLIPLRVAASSWSVYERELVSLDACLR